MRPLVRFVKHLLLAVVVIIATVCMTEVGLRAYRLHGLLTGQSGVQQTSLAMPCAIAFQHLPPSAHLSHRSVESGELVEVTTNSLGLRGGEVVMPKPPGHYRIVCLGDDATLAPDIPAGETFCGLLPAMLNQPGSKFEVINVGQPGHCPLLSLSWARARLIGLQPDLVILCCDVSDVSDDRRCRPLVKTSADGQTLSVSHPAAATCDSDLLSAVEHEFLIARLACEQFGQRMTSSGDNLNLSESDSRNALADSTPEHPTVLIEQAWEPLANLKDFCTQISAEFVVAVVPSVKSVRSVTSSAMTGTTSTGTSEILRLLSERASREQIPLLDVSSEFARQPDQSPLFLKATGVLAPAGHQLFAQILAQALLERQSVMSSPAAVPVSGEIPNEDSSAIAPLATEPQSDPDPHLHSLPTRERRPRRPAAFDAAN